MSQVNGNSVEPVPLWINGKAYVPEKSNLFPIISSDSGEKVHHAISAGVQEANLACDTASKAFRTWRNTTQSYRRGILFKAAEIYGRKIDEITKHQVAETSCAEYFGRWNVMMSMDYIREIASSSTEVRGTICQRNTTQDGSAEEGLTLVVTEPVGVVLIIPP